MAKWTPSKKISKTFFTFRRRYGHGKKAGLTTIKKYVDKMIVILPFEKQFFKNWDYEVEYVGHPLVDVIESFKKEHACNKTIIKYYCIIAGQPKAGNKTAASHYAGGF